MTNLGVWDKLASTLDDDMRLVYPELYLENQNLYDSIVAIGYLITDLRFPENGLDWVSDNQISKILLENPSVLVLNKILIVRLRLPWNKVNTEWLIGESELEAHREEYDVLESYIRAKKIGSNDIRWIFPSERQYFDEHRDEYEVVEMRYCVRWKFTEKDIENLLSNPYSPPPAIVDKNNIHIYLGD